MSEQRLTDVLDECLRLVAEEGATVEVCLSRYPQHADALRPLLELAVRMHHMLMSAPSAEAAAAGKRRMLQALAEKNRRQAEVREGLASRAMAWGSELIESWLPQRQAGFAPTLRMVSSALAAVAVVLVGALLFNSWLGVTVPRVAEVAELSGNVEVRAAAAAPWTAAAAGERLAAGAEIRAGGGSTAELALFDGSTVALEGGTQLALEEMTARRNGGARVIVIRQERGRTDFNVRSLPDAASRFEVRTLTAVAMVRGTAFAVSVESDGTTQVAVWTGLVEVVGKDTSVSLMPGWATNVRPNLPPAEPVVVPTPQATEVFAALPTLEPTATATWTATPLPPPTVEPTVAPTDTPMPSATPAPSATPKPEQEREQPAETPVAPTATAVPPTPTPMPTATQEPAPVRTPTRIPTEPRPTPMPTDTPEPVKTPTPIPTEPPVPTATPAPVDPPTPIPTEPSA